MGDCTTNYINIEPEDLSKLLVIISECNRKECPIYDICKEDASVRNCREMFEKWLNTESNVDDVITNVITNFIDREKKKWL